MKLKAPVLGCVVVLDLLLGRPAVAQAAPQIELQLLATFDRDPIGIVSANDGSDRLFIVLQAGLIMIYSGGVVLPQPFLDIYERSACCGERGLLGLAFHPEYVNNGQFYIYYSDNNEDTQVSRFLITADPNVADPDSEQSVLFADRPYGNHYGGQLQFGPDGYLYIAMGDGGSRGDPDNRGQDL